jgi:hypothetical protein
MGERTYIKIQFQSESAETRPATHDSSNDHAFRLWGSEISSAIHPSVSVSMEWDSLDDLIHGLPPARYVAS